MRRTTHDSTARPRFEADLEFDAEIFEEQFDTLALETIEASLEDVEPWQRLGDLLGRITGEVDTE